jgi:hypothetical protein
VQLDDLHANSSEGGQPPILLDSLKTALDSFYLASTADALRSQPASTVCANYLSDRAMQSGRPTQQCVGRSLVKVGETYVARAIGAIPNQTSGSSGEGVETRWRAPYWGEGTVRLSSKGESDRITQRSLVQNPAPATTNATAQRQWRSPFHEAKSKLLSLISL